MAVPHTRLRSALAALSAALLVAITLVPAMSPARAQERVPVHYDVFVQRDPATNQARIFFLDALSGLSTVVNAGESTGFTLVDDYVLYESLQTGAIMQAALNGTAAPHPFIQRRDGAQVRWVVSPDGRAIAWVTVSTDGQSAAFAAWADGSGLRQLPIDSPAAPLTLAPVALSNGMQRFVYDTAHDPAAEQPGGTPYGPYTHLAAYDITAEQFVPLPSEPNCPCGAGFTPDGRVFLRLEAPGGDGPFSVHIWDIDSGAETRVDPPDFPYRHGGDVLLNGLGTLAIYSVTAQAEDGVQRHALILVDLVLSQQYLITSPGPTRYHPHAFIDDDRAVMLVDANLTGTYKLNLDNGNLRPVSDLAYLGTITSTRRN